jgi:phage tail sheath protein FI
MAVQVSYPGVYIDEFQPAAPIQGASTSVAAFIALNAFGPPNKPTLVTSWDQYLGTFGPPAALAPEDDDYLWYAVRAFFANGGKICYVTALSNAKADSYVLRDSATQPTVLVSARAPGILAVPIKIKAEPDDVVIDAHVYALEVTVTAAQLDTKLAVTNPGRFLAGDTLVITGSGTNPPTELVTVAYTETGFVHITAPLSRAYANAKLSFAPPARSIRVQGGTTASGPASLVVGSMLTFTQTGAGAPPPLTTIVTGVRAERMAADLTYRVSLRDALTGFSNDPAKVISIRSTEFKLTVQQGTPDPTVYGQLSMELTHPRYYEKVVTADAAGLISAAPVSTPVPNNTALPGNRPIEANFVQLGNGANLDASLINVNDYDRALKLLAPINDVSIVAIPGCTVKAMQQSVLGHCSTLYDRVAVFDSVRGADLTAVTDQKASIEDNKGFGALYYPWLETTSVKTGKPLLQPPSGFIVGIYARTDLNRGVFKAPAGNEATINGVQAVEVALSDSEQGLINLKGVNVIRVFSRGGRPIVWGARTTSTDTNWQYVNIRRLFLFLEESIQVGIRGAVFEPNNPALWQKLKRTIGAFLTQQWRDGALFGNKAEEAYYVRIDEVLNPDNERALGRLYIEIGVRPSYPAEFIIVRIGIWQGGGEVSEG